MGAEKTAREPPSKAGARAALASLTVPPPVDDEDDLPQVQPDAAATADSRSGTRQRMAASRDLTRGSGALLTQQLAERGARASRGARRRAQVPAVLAEEAA